MRRLAYIAGPYAAPSAEETARNVERARLLGVLAVRRGLAPIVPHLHGAAGLYGTEHDDGGPSLTRAVALQCAEAVAWGVGHGLGHLWMILRDDASRSTGCELELRAWTEGQAARQRRVGPLVWRREGYLGEWRAWTWADWRPEIEAADIAVPEDL